MHFGDCTLIGGQSILLGNSPEDNPLGVAQIRNRFRISTVLSGSELDPYSSKRRMCLLGCALRVTHPVLQPLSPFSMIDHGFSLRHAPSDLAGAVKQHSAGLIFNTVNFGRANLRCLLAYSLRHDFRAPLAYS
ncbi:hypothetical protein [Desulfosporosinus hippei]|uniref:Uncharacterized protein n=1 Tax=Desulfosporosinus hippei DSM 8344 TaxID=1121419 RepID=A0A1G7XVH7_9FIRM|nr:hypothetical protein SAMN05443529_107116 [Desulfosporosinus hippei DSM 8344]